MTFRFHGVHVNENEKKNRINLKTQKILKNEEQNGQDIISFPKMCLDPYDIFLINMSLLTTDPRATAGAVNKQSYWVKVPE